MRTFKLLKLPDCVFMNPSPFRLVLRKVQMSWLLSRGRRPTCRSLVHDFRERGSLPRVQRGEVYGESESEERSLRKYQDEKVDSFR